MGHPLGRLALLHPFPSTLDALVTAALALIAGAGTTTAATLGVAMLAFQGSIGALNDLVDAPADRISRPDKPIPAGLVAPRRAAALVVLGGGVGLALSWLVSPVALALGAAGYGCGVAYDLELKARGLGWVAFAAAFPLLLLYAWTGSGGGLPPGWPTLLPVAALAGPALHLANGLTDVEADQGAGVQGLAARLGRRRGVRLLGLLLLAVYGLAWVTLLGQGPTLLELAAIAGATMLAGAGYAGSRSGRAPATSWGWTLQALAIGLLAVAWVSAAAG